MSKVIHRSNLFSPMSGDTLMLTCSLPVTEVPPVKYLTKFEYDNIVTKDPHTYYYVGFQGNITVFKGEVHQHTPDKTPPKYMMGCGDRHGEYVIYQVIDTTKTKFIPVAMFQSAEDAVRYMELYDVVGSHTSLSLQIHQILLNYTVNEMKLNDVILGILAIAGYRNDPRLQEVITVSRVNYGHITTNISPYLREELMHLQNHPNYLLKVYGDIFNVIVKYNFLIADQYHLNDIDQIKFVGVIEDILKVI